MTTAAELQAAMNSIHSHREATAEIVIVSGYFARQLSGALAATEARERLAQKDELYGKRVDRRRFKRETNKARRAAIRQWDQENGRPARLAPTLASHNVWWNAAA